MFRIQTYDPVSHRPITRYFKSLVSVKNWIKHFNSSLSFTVSRDFGDILYFSYDLINDEFYGDFNYLDCDDLFDDVEVDYDCNNFY